MTDPLDRPLSDFEISDELIAVLRELGVRSLREAHALGRKKFPQNVRRELKDIFDALGHKW